MAMVGAVRSALLFAAVLPTRATVIKGISYGPVPLKSAGVEEIPADDWFCDEAVSMWGSAGRGDLAVMRQLGANFVRLYGNNPENDHANFLDEAYAQGLRVSPGLSDFPYFQKGPGSCLRTEFDCFTQVKPVYLQNLRNGFLNGSQYHPALSYLNIINEPDLKMPSDADTGDIQEVYRMCRSIISAFDGLLDAEREAGVTGPLINFTVTFSFGVCKSCEFSNGKPALAQMAQLDHAMRNPEKYGYTPKNDITAAYTARFTHSFNTNNDAADVKRLFLDSYGQVFPAMPVYIAEYHSVGVNQKEDLGIILQYAKASELFLGISFFQYQVAYWKTGKELDFGIFGLGDKVVASMPYVSKTYDIYCLQPTGDIPAALAEVYGGPGLDTVTLCAARPDSVPLNQVGYVQVASQRSIPQMVLFAQRAIRHMGASVKDGHQAQLQRLAAKYSGDISEEAFASMAGYMGSRPDWIEFDPFASCLADRSVHPVVIGSAIGWVCSQGAVDCENIPPICNSSTYRLADYVFSRYMAMHGDKSNPLVSCSFGGAALFASSELHRRWLRTDLCIIAVTTSTTSTAASRSAESASAVMPSAPILASSATRGSSMDGSVESPPVVLVTAVAAANAGNRATAGRFMDKSTPVPPFSDAALGKCPAPFLQAAFLWLLVLGRYQA